MKNLFLTLCMLLTLAVSSVAMAAGVAGDFSREEAAADQFIKGLSDSTVTYDTLAGTFAPALKEKFGEAQYAELLKQVKDKFGRSKEVKFAVLQRFDKADRLIYLGSFSKEETAQIVFVFDTTGRKPLLLDFAMVPVKAQEAPQEAAK